MAERTWLGEGVMSSGQSVIERFPLGAIVRVKSPVSWCDGERGTVRGYRDPDYVGVELDRGGRFLGHAYELEVEQ